MVNKMRIPAAIFAGLIFLCSCGCAGNKADISAYGDTPITISGLTNEEFTVTPNELMVLKCVGRTATGETAKAGTVSAYGPLLNTFLAQYGKTQTDFKKIVFTASDDYRVAIAGDHLAQYEIVLAIADGNEPLSASCQPLRLLIPGAESGMWEYAVVHIEFVE